MLSSEERKAATALMTKCPCSNVTKKGSSLCGRCEKLVQGMAGASGALNALETETLAGLLMRAQRYGQLHIYDTAAPASTTKRSIERCTAHGVPGVGAALGVALCAQKWMGLAFPDVIAGVNIGRPVLRSAAEAISGSRNLDGRPAMPFNDYGFQEPEAVRIIDDMIEQPAGRDWRSPFDPSSYRKD